MEASRAARRGLMIIGVGGLALACGGDAGLKAPSFTGGSDLVECDQEPQGRPRYDCVDKEIGCGETVVGHTENGASNWDDEFYNHHFCTPSLGTKYDGPERVYRLNLPANAEAIVTLDSPCEDLDLFAVRWPDEDRCPTIDHSIGECDADTARKGGEFKLVNDHRAHTYLLGIDGKDSATGAYALTVKCYER